MALTFYSSVAKVLKRKVRKFWELIPTFRGVTMKRNKLIFWGGYFLFAPPPPPSCPAYWFPHLSRALFLQSAVIHNFFSITDLLLETVKLFIFH